MAWLCSGALHSSSVSLVIMPLTVEPSPSMIVSLPPEKDCTVPAQLVAPGGGAGTHCGCQWYGSTSWFQVLTGV